jgi:hypothetical protein
MERMKKRFTINGSDTLEQALECLCWQVVDQIRRAVPGDLIEAILLGGGYGRGEGGVLATPAGDNPYNDLEFYLFLRGSRLLNERRFSPALQQLATSLAPSPALHLDFKITSTAQWQKATPTMFSYDLALGHRLLHGSSSFIPLAPQHLQPAAIPAEEATRLLMNRASGLLFARHRLLQPAFTTGDADFVRRNIAKASLALGDAFLTTLGQYHWSCRTRNTLLSRLRLDEPFWDEIVQHHAQGVSFKLHPNPRPSSRDQLLQEHQQVSQLTQHAWLWLENRRLRTHFKTSAEYALDPANKIPGRSPWLNLLINLRHSRLPWRLGRQALRYPRERLYRSVALLLWNPDSLHHPGLLRRLQADLETSATDFTSMVQAHARLWTRYG